MSSTSLLHLPLELRSKIYNYLLALEAPEGVQPLPLKLFRAIKQHHLLSTCKQINYEFAPRTKALLKSRTFLCSWELDHTWPMGGSYHPDLEDLFRRATGMPCRLRMGVKLQNDPSFCSRLEYLCNRATRSRIPLNLEVACQYGSDCVPSVPDMLPQIIFLDMYRKASFLMQLQMESSGFVSLSMADVDVHGDFTAREKAGLRKIVSLTNADTQLTRTTQANSVRA